MSVEVVELASSDDAELSNFLDSLAQRSGSVLGYHYPFYRNMMERIGVGRPLYLGARVSGQLIGYLPVFIRESSDGSALCSLPFFGPNGGVLCVPEHAAQAHETLLSEILRVGEQRNALSCSVYTPFLRQDFAHYDTSFASSDGRNAIHAISRIAVHPVVERDPVRFAQSATVAHAGDLRDDD